MAYWVGKMSSSLECIETDSVTAACSQESTHPEGCKNQEMVVSLTRLVPQQMHTGGNELVVSSSQITKMLDEIESVSESSQLVIPITLPTRITTHGQPSPVSQAVVPSCVSSPSSTTTTICEDHHDSQLFAYYQEDCELTENCTFSREATSRDSSVTELVIAWHTNHIHV